MAITRSTTADRATVRKTHARRGGWRGVEFLASVGAALLVGAGLYFVYQSKAVDLAAVDQGLASKQLLNLNEMRSREELLPVLSFVENQRERQELARRIYDSAPGLSNVGRIRAAFSGEQFRYLKPRLVVRRPEEFRRAFFLWTLVFFAAFFAVEVWWSVRGFRGDQTFLPVLLLLCGAGLMLMISLRDPVRDNLIFVDFAQGVVAGALRMGAMSGIDYERLAGRLSFVPLLASFGLSVLLVLFGSGPGTSDVKVNLFGFQPVEIIRILLVLFLAGYFARRWELLRHVVESRESVPQVLRTAAIPPLEATLPVFACVALSLIFFFVQKDMGPALVFACVFLALYGIARGGVLVPVAGLLVVVAGFATGYWLKIPRTVGERVTMWLSPWKNPVRGGDQLAHSLWAFSTGGLSGMGPGKGEAALVPAAHTDLILSALGEDLGFLGVVAVIAIFAYLTYRGIRIALQALTDYEFFLAMGLTLATALQFLLIAGGALGLVPLTGVVTPFLSYGRTAMIANFAVVAILLSISAHGKSQPKGRAAVDPDDRLPFHASSLAAATVMGALGIAVLLTAATVQVVRADAIVGRGTLVLQSDGFRRYQYNPRFQELIRQIPKGTIYDRNGLPLASSKWDEVEQHRADYRTLGIDIDRTSSRTESRYYPFGSLMFDLLGDLRTRRRWAASNTAFIERESARRLQGFDDRATLEDVKLENGQTVRVLRLDYRELVPMLRHRHNPQHPAVRAVLDRPRDVRTSIDARLQVKVAQVLRKQLMAAKKEKGAAVVMEPGTGDVLALVSLPLPPEGPAKDEDVEGPPIDRARYGLYPPGSTFKVVTAMAALRSKPDIAHKNYQCIRLPDGRVGNFVNSSKRPIRDDVLDSSPHGTVDLQKGLVVSCNAYFAQLGTYDVGPQALLDTANLLGIAAASPNTSAQLRNALPQASYGQGQVVASPFQMARVAAAVANGGMAPMGRWISDETNPRTNAPQAILPAAENQMLARFLREVVTAGTGRRAEAAVAVAGKTGTAELENADSHAWFIGFAPYGAGDRKIAFSILVENGIYGGQVAAPAASGIVNAALELGVIGR